MNALVTSTNSSRRPWSASPENLLGRAERVDVGRVDRGDAGFAADVEDARRLRDAEIAHLGEPILAADRHRAEAEHRHAQPGIPEPPLFHDALSPLATKRVKRADRVRQIREFVNQMNWLNC